MNPSVRRAANAEASSVEVYNNQKYDVLCVVVDGGIRNEDARPNASGVVERYVCGSNAVNEGALRGRHWNTVAALDGSIFVQRYEAPAKLYSYSSVCHHCSNLRQVSSGTETLICA